jgi:hypothetical protein
MWPKFLMRRLGKVFELKNFQSFRCLPDLHFPKSISQVVWKPEVFPYLNSRFDPGYTSFWFACGSLPYPTYITLPGYAFVGSDCAFLEAE